MPPSADRSTARTRIVVVGGGVIGVSVAWRLVQAGADVTLVEADRVGSGASSGSFAWINANDKLPVAYHRLNVAGMAEHAAAARELGGAWLHLNGHARWANSESGQTDLSTSMARLRDWGYPVLDFDAAGFRRVVPGVSLPPNVSRIAYFPTEGWLDVARYVRDVRSAGERLGMKVCESFDVVEIETGPRGAQAVISRTGRRVLADAVAVCAGAQVSKVTGLVGVPISMANTIGLVSLVHGPLASLETVLTNGFINIRPDGARRYCLQAPRLDGALSSHAGGAQHVATELLSRAGTLIPALGTAQIVRARPSVRPIPADGLPIVGWLAEPGNVYVAVTHSGITLAAALGRYVAREMLGETVALLEEFRPTVRRLSRLAAGTTTERHVAT